MHLPARIIRRQCDDIPGQRPHLSFKEQDTRDRILDAAQMIMARYGRAAIRLNEFALGLRMAPMTIRRHFPDMDHLLAEILHRHIQAIITAVGQVPQDAPNRQRARRNAYLAATRILGAPTEAHLLLIRDRHLLPEDEREPIEALRLSIAEALAGTYAEPALALLDTPELTSDEIDDALTGIATKPAQAARPTQPVRLQVQPPPRPLTTIHPDPNEAQRPRAGPH